MTERVKIGLLFNHFRGLKKIGNTVDGRKGLMVPKLTEKWLSHFFSCSPEVEGLSRSFISGAFILGWKHFHPKIKAPRRTIFGEAVASLGLFKKILIPKQHDDAAKLATFFRFFGGGCFGILFGGDEFWCFHVSARFFQQCFNNGYFALIAN